MRKFSRVGLVLRKDLINSDRYPHSSGRIRAPETSVYQSHSDKQPWRFVCLWRVLSILVGKQELQTSFSLKRTSISSNIFGLGSLCHYNIHYTMINTDKECFLHLYWFMFAWFILKQSQILITILFIKALCRLSFFILVGWNSERVIN